MAVGYFDALVMKEKLKDVVGARRWRINNLLDNSCRALQAEEIVKESCQLEGKRLLYNFLLFNSEHFATERRYGRRQSQQVRSSTLVLHLSPPPR